MSYSGRWTESGPVATVWVGDTAYWRAPDGNLYKPSTIASSLGDEYRMDAYGELFTPPAATPTYTNQGVDTDGRYVRTNDQTGETQYKWIAPSGFDGVSTTGNQSVWSATQPDVSLAEKSADGFTPQINPFGLATSKTSDFITLNDILTMAGLAAPVIMPAALGALGEMAPLATPAEVIPGTGALAGGGTSLTGAGSVGTSALSEAAGVGSTSGATPVSAAGGLPDAGVDMGIFNPDQANPYATGASSAEATNAVNSAAAAGAGVAAGGGSSTLAGAAGGAAGTAAGTLTGNAVADRAIGAAVPAVIGAVGSTQQADAIRDLATQARADRAPFLALANQYASDPNSYFEGPGSSALQGVLRSLSVKGNPFGNPTSLAIATEAGMRDWRNAVTGFGNLGLAGEDTRATLGMGAIGADANALNAIGAGVNDFMNPRTNLLDVYRQLRREGLE